MKRLRTGAFACAVGVVALFAASCHGSWQISGGVYWLSSSECADGTAQALIYNPPYQGSKGKGTSGYFSADSQGCHPFSRGPSQVQVATELVKVNAGICGPANGWAGNPNGSYAVSQEWTIPYFCGGGDYYVGAHNWVLLFQGGAATNYTTQGDHWSG